MDFVSHELVPGYEFRIIEIGAQAQARPLGQNREGDRSWLGLNMMTEAKLGFRAFNEGPRRKTRGRLHRVAQAPRRRREVERRVHRLVDPHRMIVPLRSNQ